MKITNRLCLPQALVEMAKSEYQYKPKQYSVTSLLRGLRETMLSRRYHNEIEVDVSEMIWALWGRAVHNVLEHHQALDEELQEEYLKVPVPCNNGYMLSGKFDLYHHGDKKITDYKATSVWKVIYKDYDDLRKQLLMYGWMMQKIGFPVKCGEIVAFLKDHSKTKAKYDSKYPKLPVEKINFKFSKKDFEQIERFIVVRFQEIQHCEQLSDDRLPVCTPEERWSTPDKWAVMKRSRKTALRLLDSEEEAGQWITQNGKGDYIEHRPGQDKKCEDYCNVNMFCSYYSL